MGAATGFSSESGAAGGWPHVSRRTDRSPPYGFRRGSWTISALDFIPPAYNFSAISEPRGSARNRSLPHKLPHESPLYDSSHHFEATNKR
jgi:hypothetical protein